MPLRNEQQTSSPIPTASRRPLRKSRFRKTYVSPSAGSTIQTRFQRPVPEGPGKTSSIRSLMQNGSAMLASASAPRSATTHITRDKCG